MSLTHVNLQSRDSANLDFLRTVAVMYVFFVHFHDCITGSSPANHFGRIGVLLFFVHTSLVLMMSLQREHLQGTPLFVNFYVRRIFRIYPLSIACVLLIYLSHLRFRLPPVGLTSWSWTKEQLLANVLLVQNLMHVKSMLSVLWTLPIEVQMYVLLPFLFLLGGRIRVRTMLLLWCGAVAIALFQPRVSSRLNLLTYAPCFLSGIIAWMISSRFRPRLPGYLWPLALTAITLIGLLVDLRREMYFGWLFCLMVGLVVPQFSDVRSAWLNAVTKTIAKYSYGIYLSHPMAMSIAFTLVHVRAGQFCLLLVLASVLPVAMYHLIEHPGIRLGKKLAEMIAPASGGP